MPQIKSQKKRVKTNEIRRQRNVAVRSRIKTYVKEAEDALEKKDADLIDTTIRKAISVIDRACTKGVLHRNSAARKKSSLSRRAKAALS